MAMALVVIRLHEWGGQQATVAVALTKFVQGDDSVSCDNSGGAIVTIVNVGGSCQLLGSHTKPRRGVLELHRLCYKPHGAVLEPHRPML